MGQHLLGLDGGHAPKVVPIGGDIQNHRVAQLGFGGHFLHIAEGNFVVWVGYFFHNALGGQNPEAFFFRVQFHVEVVEVSFVKDIAHIQALGAAITLIALEQGLTQGGFNGGFRQVAFAADAVDHFLQAG